MELDGRRAEGSGGRDWLGLEMGEDWCWVLGRDGCGVESWNGVGCGVMGGRESRYVGV